MVAGDSYFDCDNNNKSLEQVFREMIVQDADGNPVFKTNSSGGGGVAVTYTEETLTITGVSPLIATLSHTPTSQLNVYYGGQRLTIGVDFTIATNIITFTPTANPVAGETITVTYLY